MLWSDKKTMKDAGGIIPFPKERKEGWHNNMVYTTDSENFYCLVYNNEENPVGEVSFHRYDGKK